MQLALSMTTIYLLLTKCTEQPVIFEPFNIESFIAEPPLYAGSNEG